MKHTAFKAVLLTLTLSLFSCGEMARDKIVQIVAEKQLTADLGHPIGFRTEGCQVDSSFINHGTDPDWIRFVIAAGHLNDKHQFLLDYARSKKQIMGVLEDSASEKSRAIYELNMARYDSAVYAADSILSCLHTLCENNDDLILNTVKGRGRKFSGWAVSLQYSFKTQSDTLTRDCVLFYVDPEMKKVTDKFSSAELRDLSIYLGKEYGLGKIIRQECLK